jgi:uncharacterized protein (DUF427 family)
MSVRQRDALTSASASLRHEPLAMRIRAQLDGATVVDTTRAALVWEPRRVVCEYAVPITDLHAELHPTNPGGDPPELPERGPLFPRIPFSVHTTDGQSCDVRAGNRILAGAAFRPTDHDLAELVILDFDAFDVWYQEDEQNIGHPRDPYHRIDTYPSSRRVRVGVDDTVLAASSRPMILFEAMLPPRYYLPMDDVRVELGPTDTSTVCAYKGRASYWSAEVGGTRLDDVAWGYLDPLVDSEQIRGMVCFDDSKVTVTVDAA